MSKSVLNWVEDELFRLCGMSDVDAAKFLISIAKDSKSKEKCFNKIIKCAGLRIFICSFTIVEFLISMSTE